MENISLLKLNGICADTTQCDVLETFEPTTKIEMIFRSNYCRRSASPPFGLIRKAHSLSHCLKAKNSFPHFVVND
jgi:hypothetical protein